MLFIKRKTIYLATVIGALSLMPLSATTSLADLGFSKNPSATLEALDSKGEYTKRSAIDEIKMNPVPQAAPRLVALMADKKYADDAVLALSSIGRGAIKPLKKALASKNPVIRLRAVRALSWMGTRSSIEAVIPMVHDTDGAVRAEALEAIAYVTTPKARDAVFAALGDKDPRVRKTAASALSDAPDPRAFDSLIKLLRDANPNVRKAAAVALGVSADPRAVQPLLALLKESPSTEVIGALGEIGDAKAISALIPLLSKKPLMKDTAYALGKIKDDRALTPLLAAIEKADREYFGTVAWAIGQMGPAGVKSLLSLPQEQNGSKAPDIIRAVLLSGVMNPSEILSKAEIRGQSGKETVSSLVDQINRASDKDRILELFFKLQNTEDSSVNDGFADLLGHRNTEIRVRAAGELASRGDRRGAQVLVDALQDQDPEICRMAVYGLASLKDGRVIPALLVQLDSMEDRVTENAIYYLVDFLSPQVFKAIASQLKGRTDSIRSAAVFALQKTGTKESADALVAALPELTGEPKMFAAIVLAKMHDPRAFDPLLALIKDDKSEILINNDDAISNLADADPKRAVPALLSLIDHPYWPYRQAAMIGLARTKDHDAINRVLDEITYEDAGIRQDIVFELSKSGDPSAEQFIVNGLKVGALDVVCGGCELLVGKGIEGSEPMLIAALKAHGVRSTAEGFVTCGNKTLSDAGKKWLADPSNDSKECDDPEPIPAWGSLR